MSISPSRPPRRVQSIDVGFKVIRVLVDGPGKLPLKTIAAEAGMPASKAHLYLASFADLGLVSQDEGTGHYGLGPYAVHLGLAGIRQLDVVDLARKRLPDLQLLTGKSVYLSIWGNMGPVILSKFDSDLNAPVGIRVGSVLPLLRSATGRVFLSFLPEADLKSVKARLRKTEADGETDAVAIIDRVRLDRFATSDSQVYEGFAAISAPVFDHAEALVASVTLLGLRRELDLQASSDAVAALLSATAAISEDLGYARHRPKVSSFAIELRSVIV